MNIELNKVLDDNWLKEYDLLMKDEYLSKKYNRKRRLNDHKKYINSYLPFLKDGQGNVLDIGPGMGEFLELCRFYGCGAFGIDAKIDDCEMGNEYIKLSKLMTERQNVNVKYMGFENVLNNGQLPFENNFFRVINSRGAIEQVFKKHLKGVPHKVHKNCSLLEWDITNETKKEFDHFLREVYRTLENGGVCLIYGNGAKNVRVYDELMHEVINGIDGLEIVASEKNRMHKMEKLK